MKEAIRLQIIQKDLLAIAIPLINVATSFVLIKFVAFNFDSSSSGPYFAFISISSVFSIFFAAGREMTVANTLLSDGLQSSILVLYKRTRVLSNLTIVFQFLAIFLLILSNSVSDGIRSEITHSLFLFSSLVSNSSSLAIVTLHISMFRLHASVKVLLAATLLANPLLLLSQISVSNILNLNVNAETLILTQSFSLGLSSTLLRYWDFKWIAKFKESAKVIKSSWKTEFQTLPHTFGLIGLLNVDRISSHFAGQFDLTRFFALSSIIYGSLLFILSSLGALSFRIYYRNVSSFKAIENLFTLIQTLLIVSLLLFLFFNSDIQKLIFESELSESRKDLFLMSSLAPAFYAFYAIHSFLLFRTEAWKLLRFLSPLLFSLCFAIALIAYNTNTSPIVIPLSVCFSYLLLSLFTYAKLKKYFSKTYSYRFFAFQISTFLLMIMFI